MNGFDLSLRFCHKAEQGYKDPQLDILISAEGLPLPDP